MTVLDVSNYDADHFDVDCLKENGVTGVILGCQRETIAYEMAEKARQGGLPILATYAFLYFGLQDGIGPEVVKAYRVAGDYKVAYVALDVEARPPNEDKGQTPATRTAQLRHAVSIVEAGGKKPIIYTREEYWRAEMGNTAEFARFPLWISHYGTNDPNAPRGPLRTVNFGGWTNVAIHQYSSVIAVCGRERDHNYLFELGDDMADPRVDDILKVLGDVSGWIAQGNISLIEAFGRDQQWIQKVANHLADHIANDEPFDREAVAKELRDLANALEGESK